MQQLDAEAGGREQVDRMNAILQMGEDAIYDVSLDGTLLHWNGSAERLFGYRPEEVLGKPVTMLIPEPRRGEERVILDSVRRGQRVEHYETVRVAKGGRPVDVSISVTPLRDHAGEVLGAIKVARDVTRQKRAEAALRASEARFRLTYQYAPVGIAQVAMDTGAFLDVNDKLCEIVGRTRADLLSATVADLTHPDDRPADGEQLARLAAGAVPSVQVEKRYARPDGRPVWVRVTSALGDGSAAGRPYRIAVVEDVTDRKAAETSLREREARMRAIVDGAVDAIVTIDDRGRVESANPAAERLFGYPAAEVVGRNVSMLMPEPHRGRHDGYLRAYMETGVGNVIGVGRDVTAVRRDGTVFPVHLSVHVVRLADRTLFTAVLHDLTARRELERLVAEASSVEQLRIGQDLHDGLGQQLAGLSFFCRSLATRLAAKGLPEAADADRAVELLSDALRQARGLARGLNPVMGAGDGLMSALQELAAYATGTFGVPCEFACEAPVLIDDTTFATHVYRIAQEAVTNALKHAGPSRVTVALGARGHEAVLSVEDDGTGLPERPASEGQQGPGIGREIMRSRAAFIGGMLEVRPGPAGGTLVRCVFPLPSGSDDHGNNNDN